MKKTYITPNAQVIRVRQNDIVTSSSQATIGTQSFDFYGTEEYVDTGI